MKKISFSFVALLVVVVAIASAYGTTRTTKARSLPITGWYEVIDNFLAPAAPWDPTGPLDNIYYDPARFQPGAIDYPLLDCGSTSANVCAAYFYASTEINIQSPPVNGMVYFVSGGRP